MTLLKCRGLWIAGALLFSLLGTAPLSTRAQGNGYPVFFYQPAQQLNLDDSGPLSEPYGDKRWSVNDIYRRLNELDGKVIHIDYRPLQPHPLDVNRYADDLLGYPRSIYIEFPAEKFEARFLKVEAEPFGLYVLVVATNVANQFGIISRGPVLYAVGTARRRQLGSEMEYTW